MVLPAFADVRVLRLPQSVDMSCPREFASNQPNAATAVEYNYNWFSFGGD